MLNDLLCCPFCGGDAELDTRQPYRNIATGDIEDAVAVYCLTCPTQISICRKDVPDIDAEQIIGLWNTRAQVGDLAMLLSRLAYCLKKTDADNELSAKALDYLTRHNLLPSPLRT